MWCLGLDLGQASDYTALSALEHLPPFSTVRHLQRFPLGTSYLDIVDRVMTIRAALKNCPLVIDATGVGAAVLDMFYSLGIIPIAVTITGGDVAKCKAEAEAEAKKKVGLFYTPSARELNTWTVPKRDLVAAVTVGLQTHTLKISSSLPDSKTLVDELLNFKLKINPKTAHDSYEAWRVGDHDDLVLAVALPLWRLTRFKGVNTGTESMASMMGQGIGPVPEIYDQPRDRWGRPTGFSAGDIPGIND